MNAVPRPLVTLGGLVGASCSIPSSAYQFGPRRVIPLSILRGRGKLCCDAGCEEHLVKRGLESKV